ncbi:UPF0223 family protein [Streptococcus ferus]|uniref:UPF0223 family protein n=1 Tax=Streptococcus ferus TaxID=1345 RepID=UPI0035A1878C
MLKNYAYPLDLSWSTDEIAAVLSFLNTVEKAYEEKVSAEEILRQYKSYKTVVKSKSQEKQIDRDFEKVSGYSTYQTVKAARENEKGFISLGK